MKAEQLLTLARLFESKCYSSSISNNLWSLKVYAQLNLDEPKPLYEKEIYTGNFEKLMAIFLGKDLDNPQFKDDFTAWVHNNSALLGELKNNDWGTDRFNNIPVIDTMNYRNGYTTIRLSKEPLKDVDAKEEVFLPSSGIIPKLYLYHGDSSSHNEEGSLADLPKELGHYGFLAHAFREMFNADDLMENLSKFVQKNEAKINSIRRFFRSEPKYLGAGADGAAFSIGEGYILKLFRDKRAFIEASKAMERLHSSPSIAKTEAMIYDVGQLGYYKGYNIYYYIMEKMRSMDDLPYSVSNRLGELVNTILYRYLRRHRSETDPLKKSFEAGQTDIDYGSIIKSIASKISEEAKSENKQDIDFIESEVNGSQETPLKDNWVALLAEELLVKYMTSREDLHMGNIGLTNYGEFRYFDPAYGGGMLNSLRRESEK